MKKKIVILSCSLSILMGGCSTATLDSYGISVEAARTSTLMVSAGVIAGLIYLELNSRNGWQASIKQMDDTHYDVVFGRSILSFEPAQPISGSARDVMYTVCSDGGRWKRLEEGVNAQQIGVRYYAKGLLECFSNNEKLLEKMKKEKNVIQQEVQPLPPLDGTRGLLYKNVKENIPSEASTSTPEKAKDFVLPNLPLFDNEKDLTSIP